MKGLKKSYTSMSVSDLDEAVKYYTETLGLEVEHDASPNAVMLACGGSTRCMIYPKDNHEAASHTVLSFDVENIEATKEDLESKGVEFNTDQMTGENGIFTQGETKIAWFNDPFGNFLSLSENI